MGAEIVPGETIPAVTGVTGVAVNFTKGCYPGQELVERMDSRGAEAPSSLRVLAIGVDVPLTRGAGRSVVDASGRRSARSRVSVRPRRWRRSSVATTVGAAPAHLD